MVLPKAGGGGVQKEAVLPSPFRSFYFRVGLVFLSCSFTWALQFSIVKEGKTFCPPHKDRLTCIIIVFFYFCMQNISYCRSGKIRLCPSEHTVDLGGVRMTPLWAKSERRDLGKGRQFFLGLTWGVYSKICPKRRSKISWDWLYWCWDLTPKFPNIPEFSVNPGETSRRNLCAQSSVSQPTTPAVRCL